MGRSGGVIRLIREGGEGEGEGVVVALEYSALHFSPIYLGSGRARDITRLRKLLPTEKLPPDK